MHSPYKPMLNWVLVWRPSWISDHHKKYKLNKGLSKEHYCIVSVQLVWWFLTRRFLKIGKFESLLAPNSHFGFQISPKNTNLNGDHPRTISANFGLKWLGGSWEEDWNVKSLQTTDDGRRTPDAGRQVMAKAHLSPWLRWAKQILQ